METNVVAAVRVYNKDESNEDHKAIQISHYDPNMCPGQSLLAAVHVDAKSFPVSFAFGSESRQETVYQQMLAPFMSSFLEGFDVSVVTYGQKGTGKSYSCYGNGVGCISNETDYGLCQRFIRELFQQLAKRPERTCRISISWNEICDDDEEQFLDILNNMGQVQCCGLKEVFDWMEIGLNSRNPDNHNIFTLMLEQQWVTDNGYNQHKLSTLSFCDLCGTERQFVTNEFNQNISQPRNFSLQALEYSILSTVDPNYTSQHSNMYNQSTLPTLLKDSFGGRAQTIFMLCISSHEKDMTETLFNLDIAFKAQMLVNFVYMNAFTDNNVPIDTLYQNPNEDLRNNNNNNNQNIVNPNQTFAMQQWLKLLQNAEGLFNKIILTHNSEGIKPDDIQQIEEWLYLKAECDDCINLNEINAAQAPEPERILGPIEEIDEEDQQTQDSLSENESDSDEVSQKINDIDTLVEKLMLKFESKTDALVEKNYRAYIESHPQTLDSIGSMNLETHYHGTRRKSIQPGVERFVDNDIGSIDPLTGSSDMKKKVDNETKLADCIQSIIETDIQIEMLEREIKTLDKEIREGESKEIRGSIKSRTNKQALEKELAKANKNLQRAVANKKGNVEVEKLREFQQRIEDELKMQSKVSETSMHLKKQKQQMHKNRKKLEHLKKNLKKEKKNKESLEKQIETERKLSKQAMTKSDGKNKIRDINNRIQNLNIRIKEKDDSRKNGDDSEALRREINYLRLSKNYLNGKIQRIKREKAVSGQDEDKLMEYLEHVDVIDTLIEIKNEQINGRQSVDTDESIQREKGEQLMLARLNNLSIEEMRTLLYLSHKKSIDYKKNGKDLEKQLSKLEEEKERWVYREKFLQNHIKQIQIDADNKFSRLKHRYERGIQQLIREYQTKLNQVATNQTLMSQMHGELNMPHFPRIRQQPTNPLDILSMQALNLPSTNEFVHGLYKPPPVPLKEKEQRESKNFLQTFFRYNSEKKKSVSIIPPQNLKQLNNSTNTTAPRDTHTKVTVLETKLVFENQN